MLNQEKVKIDDIISHKYRFEAHENETIQEHTDKCVMFFEQIWKAKKLDSTLEMLEQVLLGEQMVNAGNCLKDFFFIRLFFMILERLTQGFNI